MTDGEERLEDRGRGKKRKEEKKQQRKEEEDDLEVAAVLFIENTKGGALAKEIRGVLERLQVILGYKIKVVERSGNPPEAVLPPIKDWRGEGMWQRGLYNLHPGEQRRDPTTLQKKEHPI